jgi:hypothetical protein
MTSIATTVPNGLQFQVPSIAIAISEELGRGVHRPWVWIRERRASARLKLLLFNWFVVLNSLIEIPSDDTKCKSRLKRYSTTI